MASKQLGKLRQWAGEVISVRDKTVLSEEFRELEHDVELRRRGLWRLHVASHDYHHALSKKKVSEVVDTDEKLLPIDALGVVMIQHGEEFGDDSAFGMSLVSMGRAHCQIATLQESFSVLFQETYLASLQRAEDDIKEYQAQRKKLDSRRLTFDAAATKLEKVRNSKKEKEKERQEVEDEYEIAKSRYEECAEDVRVRMYAIQENEIDQLRDLTSFLDMELHFVEQYLEVLKDVKANWVDEATLASMERATRSRPHNPISEPRPIRERRRSIVSKKSATGSDDSSIEEEAATKSSLMKSLSLRRSDQGSASKPPSRPPSRNERKRADSLASVGTDKEKDKQEKSKRISVTGWATSKMGSLTGRGKKEKLVDALMQENDSDSDGDDARTQKARRPSTSSHSSPTKTRSTPNASPMLPARTPPLRAKKIALAMHDFKAASQDELSFKAGDQINVVSEVLDGWWMGELNGKTGLFPTTYTEITNASTSSLPKPRLPPRPPFTPGSSQPPSRASPAPSHEEPTIVPEMMRRRDAPRWLAVQATGDSLAESEDGEHPFGDHLVAASRSPLNGTFYAESIASSGDESESRGHGGAHDDDDDDEHDDAGRLVPSRDDRAAHEHIGNGAARLDDEHRTPRTLPPALPTRQMVPAAKRAPPPPPPPRRATLSGSAPPIPWRPGVPGSTPSSQSTSTNASFVSIGPDVGEDGLTGSPFD